MKVKANPRQNTALALATQVEKKQRKRRRPYEGRPSLPPPRDYRPTDLLLEAEAAAILRNKENTLKLWRHQQTQPGLKYIRIGNGPRATVRYLYSDLLAFIEAGRTSSPA